MAFERWLRKLSELHPARNNAPHKPLLLLVFLEMIEKGEFVGGNLRLTPELAYRFDTFFDVVRRRWPARTTVRMPFHHLGTQGFWSPRMANGGISKHRSTTEFVVPDSEFVAACLEPEFRRQARYILIATHFEPAERNALYHLVGIETPNRDIEFPNGNVVTRDTFLQSQQEAEKAARTARFRIEVVSAYNYTCALTGYRVTTIDSGAIVDAAHIHPFSKLRNNDPNNGISLCKNAHWLFDVGLWAIDDQYCVIVAKEAFSEESPNQKPLKDMQGQPLLLPRDEAIWPSKVHLAWHRTHKFKGAL